MRNVIKKKKKSKALHKRKCYPWLHAFPTKSNSGNFLFLFFFPGNFLIIMNQHPAWLATKPVRTWDVSTRIILSRIMLTESQIFSVSNISKNVVITGILEFHEVFWLNSHAVTLGMDEAANLFCHNILNGSFLKRLFL